MKSIEQLKVDNAAAVKRRRAQPARKRRPANRVTAVNAGGGALLSIDAPNCTTTVLIGNDDLVGVIAALGAIAVVNGLMRRGDVVVVSGVEIKAGEP